MNNLKSALFINDLALQVHLGWGEPERLAPQTILLSVAIRFPTPPKACVTDALEDTWCYDQLIAQLRINLSAKPFRLIEHLAQAIYDHLKTVLGTAAQLQINLTKHPAISGLTGGVCFTLGDF